MLGISRLEAVLLVGGPALFVAGWVALIANAGQGPNGGWFAGHYALLLANAAWIPIVLVLTRVAGRPISVEDWVLWLTVLGALAVAGQLAIDLAAWALSLDADGLRDFFAALRARPLLSLTVHTVGPSLLFLGLFVASVRVASARHSARLGAVSVAVGILIVLVGALTTFSYVVLGGYVVVLAGFAMLAYQLRRRDSPSSKE